MHIWGCPTHVLKGKVDKLKSRSEVCLFISYLRGRRGGFFSVVLKKKVFISTNVAFLEEYYIKILSLKVR